MRSEYSRDYIISLVHDLSSVRANAFDIKERAKRWGEDTSDWSDLADAFDVMPQDLVNEAAVKRVSQAQGAWIFEIGGWKIPQFREKTSDVVDSVNARLCYGDPEEHARQAFRELYGTRDVDISFTEVIGRAWGIMENPQVLSCLSFMEAAT